MGADLLLTWAPVSEKTIEELCERANQIDADTLLTIADYLGWDDYSPQDVVDQIHGAVKSIVDGGDHYRDLHIVDLGGGPHYITGGTSYGDSPGPSWDEVVLLAETGITDDKYWESRE